MIHSDARDTTPNPAFAALRATARNAWVRWLARFGFYAKALVYLVVASLALGLALGAAGGETTDTRGALTEISRAPLGSVAVLVLAVALAGLSLWFVVDGLTDPDDLRSGRLAWLLRLGQTIGGLGYLGLAIWAFALFFGTRGADVASDTLAKSWTGHALDLPGGTALVLLVGAIVAVVGARQMRVGVQREFFGPLDVDRMPARMRRAAAVLGTLGFVSQGFVFALVGLFFVQAAVEQEAWEATGFDGALAVLARQPHGAVLLGAAAVGLIAYAAYAAIEGTYRRYGR